MEPKYKNERWTKVLKIGEMDASNVFIVLIKEDHEYHLADPLPPKKTKKEPWALLFDPEKLVKDHGTLETKDFKLSKDELWKHATTCSQIRAQIRAKALFAE